MIRFRHKLKFVQSTADLLTDRMESFRTLKFGHAMRKPVFSGLRLGKTQTGLLSYRDQLEL